MNIPSSTAANLPLRRCATELRSTMPVISGSHTKSLEAMWAAAPQSGDDRVDWPDMKKNAEFVI
ncbi:hypothetical protein [Bradyrhizobium sp.]|uniref:hypothetical protein n=1 Tax=Bradyrhizobium sp. TaxID=376 RepID=UPI003C737359